MTQIENYNNFCEAAMLNNSNWIKRRENGKEYANFMIVKSSGSTWYQDFIGVEFLGEIYQSPFTKQIDVYPVRLNKTIVHHGRGLKFDDLMII